MLFTNQALMPALSAPPIPETTAEVFRPSFVAILATTFSIVLPNNFYIFHVQKYLDKAL
jgi:hypothetical protein